MMNASNLLKSSVWLLAALTGVSIHGHSAEAGKTQESSAEVSLAFPGRLPGAAKGVEGNRSVELSNDAISAAWSWSEGRLKPVSLVNKLSNSPVTVPEEVFILEYRDGDTHERIVKGGPLYPINSMMLHGIIYARKAHDLDTDPSGAFVHEVRSYFGTGTQLQEMYISHDLLTQKDWDELAACAKWSRANAGTLVDTHWLGGDPRKLEVYGWPSWSPAKGILTIRNPFDKEQAFTIGLDKAFELPAGAPGSYALSSPYKQRQVAELQGKLGATRPLQIKLLPFEVLVFEAIPM